MEHVAAADRVPVDPGDDRLRKFADQPVQVLDLEQPRLRGTVVAGLRALLLVAPGAERPVAGPREADDAHRRIGPGPLEALDELVHGARSKRVHPLLPVDGYPGEAAIHLVTNVRQLVHLSSSESGDGHDD